MLVAFPRCTLGWSIFRRRQRQIVTITTRTRRRNPPPPAAMAIMAVVERPPLLLLDGVLDDDMDDGGGALVGGALVGGNPPPKGFMGLPFIVLLSPTPPLSPGPPPPPLPPLLSVAPAMQAKVVHPRVRISHVKNSVNSSRQGSQGQFEMAGHKELGRSAQRPDSGMEAVRQSTHMVLC